MRFAAVATASGRGAPAPSGSAAATVLIRGSPAMVIMRSASMWMLASTVFADCRAIG